MRYHTSSSPGYCQPVHVRLPLSKGGDPHDQKTKLVAESGQAPLPHKLHQPCDCCYFLLPPVTSREAIAGCGRRCHCVRTQTNRLHTSPQVGAPRNGHEDSLPSVTDLRHTTAPSHVTIQSQYVRGCDPSNNLARSSSQGNFQRGAPRGALSTRAVRMGQIRL